VYDEIRTMFSLEFDRGHKVLLTRFSGMLLPDDIRGFDEAVRHFVRGHGAARGLLDFTGVSVVASPHSFFRSPSRPPQISLEQRPVVVAPQEELFALAHRYATQERDYGNIQPIIVPTMAEAYEVLNIEAPNFVPVNAFAG
jgi:hypothetical protein